VHAGPDGGNVTDGLALISTEVHVKCDVTPAVWQEVYKVSTQLLPSAHTSMWRLPPLLHHPLLIIPPPLPACPPCCSPLPLPLPLLHHPLLFISPPPRLPPLLYPPCPSPSSTDPLLFITPPPAPPAVPPPSPCTGVGS
jgi:hypothetical protein